MYPFEKDGTLTYTRVPCLQVQDSPNHHNKKDDFIMHIKKKRYLTIFFLSLSLCLCTAGCSGQQASPFDLAALGFNNYKEVFGQFFTHEAPETILVSQGSSIAQTVSPVQEPVNADAPVYAAYSYYLPNLSGDEASNFYALYQGIQSFKTNITLPVPVSSQEVNDLMLLLTNECPELLQLASQWTEHSNLLGYVVSVSPQYTIGQDDCASQLAAVEALLEQWHNALAGQNAYDVELFIYNYILENCRYSTAAQHCQSAYGALIGGYAKCDGRAKAMVWALRSFGITSSVITGSTHAWVIAHIGDYDYNADPTYDDNEGPSQQLPVSYAYFNVPAAAVASNPYPADDFYQRRGYPSTTRWDANYHVQSGLWVASGADASATAKALFLAQLDSAWQNGSGLINLRFEAVSDYEAAAASCSGWIQDYINRHAAGCSMVNYDYSQQQILSIAVSFQ